MTIILRGDELEDIKFEVIDGHSYFVGTIKKSDQANFPYLQYIDPYSDTTFNSLQMTAIIPELENLVTVASNVEARRVIEKVLAMAMRCNEEVHTYMTFAGD